jgi:hypothetical protein
LCQALLASNVKALVLRPHRAKLVASVSWLDDGQDGCGRLNERWPKHAKSLKQDGCGRLNERGPSHAKSYSPRF